jgi:hypothetical protein
VIAAAARVEEAACTSDFTGAAAGVPALRGAVKKFSESRKEVAP